MARKKKNKIEKIFALRILIVPCLIIFMFSLISIFKQVIKAHNINKEIQILEQEISKMEDENTSLVDNLNYYKTVSFLENEARVKMGMKNEGEGVAIVLAADNIEEIFHEEQKKHERDLSNPQKWFYYFFRKDLLNK